MKNYLIKRGNDPDKWSCFKAKNDQEAQQKASRLKGSLQLYWIWCGGSKLIKKYRVSG